MGIQNLKVLLNLIIGEKYMVMERGAWQITGFCLVIKLLLLIIQTKNLVDHMFTLT